MDIETTKRSHFCLSSTFLLVLGIVTFTIAVFEGIGGAVLWTHYQSELQEIRGKLDTYNGALSIQGDSGQFIYIYVHI